MASGRVAPSAANCLWTTTTTTTRSSKRNKNNNTQRWQYSSFRFCCLFCADMWSSSCNSSNSNRWNNNGILGCPQKGVLSELYFLHAPCLYCTSLRITPSPLTSHFIPPPSSLSPLFNLCDKTSTNPKKYQKVAIEAHLIHIRQHTPHTHSHHTHTHTIPSDNKHEQHKLDKHTKNNWEE